MSEDRRFSSFWLTHKEPTKAADYILELEAKLAAAEVYMKAMKHALHGISLCSQNSMSDKRECGTIARQTIAAIDAASRTADVPDNQS